MIVFELILFFMFVYLYICIAKINKFKVEPKFNKNNTYTLRGIAMILIMLHHCSQYMNNVNEVGEIFKTYGFLPTGLFFFLSGYVNCCALSTNKKDKYIALKWFFRRIIELYKVMLPSFVLLLAIIMYIKNIDSNYIQELLVSLVTITLPVTRLWYIKAQILLYAILAITFLGKHKYKGVVIIIIDLGIILSMRYFLKMPSNWWNTQLCFCFGVVYSLFREVIEDFVAKKKGLLVGAIVCFLISAFVSSDISLAVSTCIIVILINSCKCSDKYVISWMGKNSLYYFIVHVVVIQLSYNLISNDNLFVLFVFLASTVIVSILAGCGYWLDGCCRKVRSLVLSINRKD